MAVIVAHLVVLVGWTDAAERVAPGGSKQQVHARKAVDDCAQAAHTRIIIIIIVSKGESARGLEEETRGRGNAREREREREERESRLAEHERRMQKGPVACDRCSKMYLSVTVLMRHQARSKRCQQLSRPANS